MKVTAIVERSSDGLYSIYSEDTIGRDCFGGYGENVEEAKQDFLRSIQEAIENARKDGFDNVPIPSFFNYFDFFNVSKFASYAGINESRMRAYKSGTAFPGEKTTRKILLAVQKIVREMSVASF